MKSNSESITTKIQTYKQHIKNVLKSHLKKKLSATLK